MSTSKLQLLSDLPIGETGSLAKDGLNFEKYAQVLGEVAINTTGPFTIGIFGEWGTGKTSLMKLIESYLSKNKRIATIWFNAWRYEKEDEPLFPLLATIIREIENQSGFLGVLNDKGKSLLTALRAVAYGFTTELEFGVPGIGKVKGKFVAKDMIDREKELTIDPIRDKSLYIDAYKALEKVDIPDASKIVVIIDDLDRCFPDHAIKLLESIKLILNQPGFIFVIGVARDVLEGYLQHRYQSEFGIAGFRGQDYLDKIVQLPFHIPPHHARMENLWTKIIERLDENDKEDFKNLIPIISPATGSNPRAAVRYVNNLLIDRAIYHAIPFDKKRIDIHISFFAVSRSLQQRWPRKYALLSRSEKACRALNDSYENGTIDFNKLKELGYPDEALKISSDPDLYELLISDFGLEWLRNEKKRKATIDFLRTQRSDSTGDFKYDVYLSFHPVDYEIGNYICRMFAKHGIKYCTVIEEPPASKQFPSITRESPYYNAIEDSATVVFLVGPSSIKRYSDDSRIWLESSLAVGKKKKVFTILLPHISQETLPSSLRNQFVVHISEESEDSLISAVQSIINEIISAKSSQSRI